MRIKRFTEATLNLAELEKTIKTGGNRGQKLVDRLKGDQNFTISQKNKPEKQINFENPDEIVDNITTGSDQFDTTKAKNFLTRGKNYTKVFIGDDDENYKLNDIKKDAYFGSSAGSSLGIEKTRVVESLQCLFLALKQQYPMKNLIESDLNLLFKSDGTIDPKILNFVVVPIELDEEFVHNFFEQDTNGWIKTFLNTANALSEKDLQLVDKKHRTVFKQNVKYNFHQIGCESELVKSISNAYDRLENSGIPISKWTPSDVWAVNSQLENRIISQIKNCRTIQELNNLVNSKFLKSQMVGLSLKKIGGGENINLIINKLTPTPRYKYGGVVTSDHPFGSMGIKFIGNFESDVIKGGRDTMYLRSFQGSDVISNISGEVEGSHSRYGKIGLEWINYILSDNGVMNDDLIPTKIQMQLNESYTLDFIKSEVERMNRLILNKTKGTKRRITGKGSIISKYQALKFAVLMENLHQAEVETLNDGDEVESMVDKITEDIFYYALAIKNFSFECPMYVRIVTDKI